MYNNNESAQEDNQKTDQKPASQENGDGFECKVEGKRLPTHTHTDVHAGIHTRNNMQNTLKATVDVGQICFEGT